jgi:hypothetical protein
MFFFAIGFQIGISDGIPNDLLDLSLRFVQIAFGFVSLTGFHGVPPSSKRVDLFFPLSEYATFVPDSTRRLQAIRLLSFASKFQIVACSLGKSTHNFHQLVTEKKWPIKNSPLIISCAEK